MVGVFQFTFLEVFLPALPCREDQAADRAGLPEHGQREALRAGRGRQAAGGGQLPGADQVRHSTPPLGAVCLDQAIPVDNPLLLSPSWIYSSLPVNKQMLAVSATYPEALAAALSRYMREPTFVRLNPTDPALLGEHTGASGSHSQQEIEGRTLKPKHMPVECTICHNFTPI